MTNLAHLEELLEEAFRTGHRKCRGIQVAWSMIDMRISRNLLICSGGETSLWKGRASLFAIHTFEGENRLNDGSRQ